MVNGLITNFVRVNVLINGNLRRVTTGDDHEEQETDRYPWPLVVAIRPWLERWRRQRLTEFRPFRPVFRQKS